MNKLLFALFLAVFAAASLPALTSAHGPYIVQAAPASDWINPNPDAAGPSDTSPRTAHAPISTVPMLVKIAAGLVFSLFLLLAVFPVMGNVDAHTASGVMK